MNVILLENIQNLGKFGNTVKVAGGYGRNFLIPQRKALPATKANLETFEARRAELEAQMQEKLAAATARGDKLAETSLTLAARSSEEGKLYGSVGTVEIVNALHEAGFTDVQRQEILLPDGPMREIGTYQIQLRFHPEVIVTIQLTVEQQKTK